MEKHLFESCEKCLQDEPAASTARCPVHVDVAAFAYEVEKGNFSKAYQLLAKRVPFAGIVCMICNHPCEAACVRSGLDSAVRISELERAAVTYGYSPFKKGFSVSKKNGRVAVIGGGVSGVSTAYELDRKGFQVTIIEKSSRIGGRFWSYADRLIAKDQIENELSIIDKLGVKTVLNHPVTEVELKKIIAEYDAVFLGTGEWEKELRIDPETFQVSGALFAGGRLLKKGDSIIDAVSSGKRAAVSMERYVKKSSMTASREREGSYESLLRYNLAGAPPAPAVEKTQEVYTREEAAEEAKRCFKCRCVECVKACAHLQKFNMTPKSYAKQIQINENVILGTHYANKMINSCTMCGLCGEQCPSSIGMKEVIHQARENMVEKGKMPVSAHDFALKDMEFSSSDRFFLVKSPPPIPEEQRKVRERELFTYPRLAFSKYAQSVYKGDSPGKEQADYLFFPGCQLSASSPEYVEKTYGYLVSVIKEGVGLMLGCCGAPADWAGRQDRMADNIERIRKAWEELGKPILILACSSCCEIFEKYLSDIPFVSLWEIFDQYGLPSTAKNGAGHILNVHDACSTRHNTAVQDSVRSIAEKLGYEIRELKYTKEKTKCCGYGGLVYFANREQSDDFVRERLGESDSDLLVYCAMCKDLFVGGGKKTFHILDLIFAENPDEAALKKMPNLSERHVNRSRLKKNLLKNFWKEEFRDEPAKMTEVAIPDGVWRVMEERYILREDVESVIRHSRKSGERFFNPEDSSYLAFLRIQDVTFWVRYTEQDEKIQILTVYSHRMDVKQEKK